MPITNRRNLVAIIESTLDIKLQEVRLEVELRNPSCCEQLALGLARHFDIVISAQDLVGKSVGGILMLINGQ